MEQARVVPFSEALSHYTTYGWWNSIMDLILTTWCHLTVSSFLKLFDIGREQRRDPFECWFLPVLSPSSTDGQVMGLTIHSSPQPVVMLGFGHQMLSPIQQNTKYRFWRLSLQLMALLRERLDHNDPCLCQWINPLLEYNGTTGKPGKWVCWRHVTGSMSERFPTSLSRSSLLYQSLSLSLSLLFCLLEK